MLVFTLSFIKKAHAKFHNMSASCLHNKGQGCFTIDILVVGLYRNHVFPMIKFHVCEIRSCQRFLCSLLTNEMH